MANWTPSCRPGCRASSPRAHRTSAASSPTTRRSRPTTTAAPESCPSCTSWCCAGRATSVSHASPQPCSRHSTRPSSSVTAGSGRRARPGQPWCGSRRISTPSGRSSARTSGRTASRRIASRSRRSSPIRTSRASASGRSPWRSYSPRRRSGSTDSACSARGVATMNGLYIVDADGHIDETHVDWASRLPEEFRAMAPERRPAGDRQNRVMIEGRAWPKPDGPGIGVGGPYNRPPPRRDGMWDPLARMADLDTEQFAVTVLFGGALGGSIPVLDDPELAAALARARDDWVAEYCAAAPARLKAIASLPLQDPDLAVDELRRAVIEHGFVGALLPPNCHGRHPGDPYFYPVYAEAERLNVALCIHGVLGRWGSESTGTMRFDRFFYSHLVGHVFEQMTALAVVLGEGMLDRFPRLRWVFLESGCGWLPSWLARLDEHWEVLGVQVPALTERPSKLLERGLCYFSCEPEESELAHVVDTIGDDHIVFASDYTHFDSIFPGAAHPILANPRLSAMSKHRILSGNARRLYA